MNKKILKKFGSRKRKEHTFKVGIFRIFTGDMKKKTICRGTMRRLSEHICLRINI